MTKKIVYGVIGNNWGSKIYNILKLKKKCLQIKNNFIF